MSSTEPAICIQGITHAGKTFRPSDWAERLAGVMSQFRPDGMGNSAAAHLSYSPWCEPNTVGEIKCVIVHPDLRLVNLMAWEFVMNFARDNDLVTGPVCKI